MLTKSIKIAEGVVLNYIETEKFKTNYFSFNFVTNLSKEEATNNALIPLILMRGCQKYSSQQEINKRLQFLYSGEIVARNDKFGEYQIFGLKANMLDNKFTGDTNVTEDMITLICDMIFEPYVKNGAFDYAYVNGEKNNLTDIIQSEINNKTKYAMKRLMEEMCKGEIFSISKYGTLEQMSEITPKSLCDAYFSALNTLPIQIYFIGKCNLKQLENVLKERFSKINRKVKDLKFVKTVEKASEIKQIVDEENVNQGKLCLGFRTGYKPEENKYHLLQLFNEVFGGSPTSKLFMNVREKMSLCYYCRSIVNQRNGTMIVASGIEFKNKEIAENAIINQLDEIKNGKISAEELDSAKKSIKNGYMQIYDSADSMEAWSFFRGLCGIKTTPKNECEKIDQCTVDDIKSIADKMTLDTVYFLKGKEQQEDV